MSPYVIQDIRDELDPSIEKLIQSINALESPGAITYIICKLLYGTLLADGEISYTTVALADGILGTASKELYRRIGSFYEEQKIGENGDVFYGNK